MAYRTRRRAGSRARGSYRKPAVRTRRAPARRTSARRSGGTQRVVIQVVGAPAGANPAPFSVATPAPRTRRF